MRIISFCSHTPSLQFLEALLCPIRLSGWDNRTPTRWIFICRLISIWVNIFLSRSSSVGVEGYCCAWSHSVGVPWSRHRPVAKAPNCTTHNIHKRQIFMSQPGFEHAIPAGVRPPGWVRFGLTTDKNNRHFTWRLSWCMIGHCNGDCALCGARPGD